MRDFEALYRGRQHADKYRMEREILELPPAYIDGMQVLWMPNYQALVKAGIASVNGRQIRISEDIELSGENWKTERVGSRYYYVYLSQGAELYVDSVAPLYDTDLLDFYHVEEGHRAIGTLYVDSSGDIVYAVSGYGRY